jgi:hypothetical protein
MYNRSDHNISARGQAVGLTGAASPKCGGSLMQRPRLKSNVPNDLYNDCIQHHERDRGLHV